MARQQTPEARFKISGNIEQINRGTVDRNDAFINEMFGNKSGFMAKEEAMQAAKEKARPLFNELENMGDLANAQPKPTREQLVSYPAESKFNPNGNYTKEQAIQKLRERANQANTSIFNDELTYKGDRYGANHFVQNKDIPNIRTINNTINKPDISYSNTVNGNPRDFYVKKYQIPQESDLLDFVITQDGKYFDKFKTDTNYVSNQINMPVKDLSFNRRVSVQDPISGGQNITSVSNIPSLGEIVKGNDVIADAISKVKRSYSSLKNLPDTDARVILEARKLLSKQSANQLDSTAAYQARQALKEFDPALKNVFGDKLEQANKLYAGAHQFENAYEQGSNIFNKITPDEFGNMLKNMTADEKIALKGGMKDELWNIIHGRENETLGWKRVVPKSAQDKIRMALGEKEGNKLIAYANAEIKKMRNFNELLQGSKTSEKQYLRDAVGTVRRALKNTTGIIGEVLPAANARNRGIAEIMTNPSATTAREAFNQVVNPTSKLEALYQALYNPSGNTTAVNAALAAYLANMPLKNN